MCMFCLMLGMSQLFTQRDSHMKSMGYDKRVYGMYGMSTSIRCHSFQVAFTLCIMLHVSLISNIPKKNRSTYFSQYLGFFPTNFSLLTLNL